MKANELMIGDWVECIYWTPSKQLKVAEIRRIIDDEIKIGVYCNDLVLIFRQLEVKPIPLTTEILERNGFEKALQVSDTEPFDTDEDGNKHYSYNKTFWGWWQPDNIFCIPANGLGWLNIKYVHQLQHALRLCGINHEIIL